MELSIFQAQTERLKGTYGDRNYPDERLKLFWRAFANCFATDFEDAVSECVANRRAPPMLKELGEAIESAKSRRLSYRGPGGIGDVLRQAEASNKLANPELVRECVKLFERRHAPKHGEGPLTYEQFQQGCDYLDDVAVVMGRK